MNETIDCDIISSLPSDSYKIIRPINIFLKIYSYEVIALWPEIELYAYGNDKFEAVGNLKMEVLDLLGDLAKFDYDKLGTKAKNWTRILERFVGKCQ